MVGPDIEKQSTSVRIHGYHAMYVFIYLLRDIICLLDLIMEHFIIGLFFINKCKVS